MAVEQTHMQAEMITSGGAVAGEGQGDVNNVDDQRISLESFVTADLISNIVRFMDDPEDVIRLAAVSRYFFGIVLESRCLKDQCIRICPEATSFESVSRYGQSSSSEDSEWANLRIQQNIYSKLTYEFRGLPINQNCISEAIYASSTDNYPDESIDHTLDRRQTYDGRPSYWSSKGSVDTKAPETLTYRLHTNLSVIHEVQIRPFKAYFHRGSPIYSAMKIRFRFGHWASSFQKEEETLADTTDKEGKTPADAVDKSSSGEYIWTYVSPEYAMLQEDKLQDFTLPHPVLCIGNILQIELMGRVQVQESDGLYYICICHVHVVGRPISTLDFAFTEHSRKYVLTNSEEQHPLADFENAPFVDMDEDADNSIEQDAQIRARRIHRMLRHIAMADLNGDYELDSDNEDFLL